MRTVIFSVGYVGDTTDGGHFDQVQPVAEADEHGRVATSAAAAAGDGPLPSRAIDEIVVVHLCDDHARPDVECDGDPPHVRLRRDAGNGADRRDHVVHLWVQHDTR